MARSSISDDQKDLDVGKDHDDARTTEGDDLPIEAYEIPFTEKVELEDGGTLTQVSTKLSANNIKNVPNGGTTAWLQVVSSFFIFFNTWGLVNAFGVYLTYYENGILSTSTPSRIAWIGSIQSFLLIFVGSLTGPVYDSGYARELLAAGSFLIVFGQMMVSLCSSYWQVLLAQGFCVGIGTGFIFVSGLAILSTYFSTKLATATGIAAAGSSIGGMLYPIIFAQLQTNIGFPWATRVLAFIALITLTISNLVLRIRVIPPARRKLFDWPAWKEPPYVLFNLGMLIAFFGLYGPFVYIQSYALETGIMGPNLAFYTIAVLNAASTFGRVIPNIIADKIGPLNVIVPCAFLTGILQYSLVGARGTGSVMAIIALFGFFSGTLVSLPGTIYVQLAGEKNRSRIGTRMGMGFATASIGVLTGTPISGAVLKASSFEYVWIYGGTMLCAGSMLIMFCRLAQSEWKLWAKV